MSPPQAGPGLNAESPLMVSVSALFVLCFETLGRITEVLEKKGR